MLRNCIPIAIFSLCLAGCNNAGQPTDEHAVAGGGDNKGQMDTQQLSQGTTYAPDGVEIYYEVSGTQQKPTDPTLIFIHGWSCNIDFWREQLPVFASSHRVVALDLGGHGKSGTDRGVWGIADYGNDVAAVAAKLKLDNVILIGHSMGGAGCACGGCETAR